MKRRTGLSFARSIRCARNGLQMEASNEHPPLSPFLRPDVERLAAGLESGIAICRAAIERRDEATTVGVSIYLGLERKQAELAKARRLLAR
jgi:hypothetical protein